MRMVNTLTSAVIVAFLAFAAQAQIDPTRESTPATPLSTTLGLVVSPAKGQTREQRACLEARSYIVK